MAAKHAAFIAKYPNYPRGIDVYDALTFLQTNGSLPRAIPGNPSSYTLVESYIVNYTQDIKTFPFDLLYKFLQAGELVTKPMVSEIWGLNRKCNYKMKAEQILTPFLHFKKCGWNQIFPAEGNYNLDLLNWLLLHQDEMDITITTKFSSYNKITMKLLINHFLPLDQHIMDVFATDVCQLHHLLIQREDVIMSSLIDTLPRALCEVIVSHFNTIWLMRSLKKKYKKTVEENEYRFRIECPNIYKRLCLIEHMIPIF